MFIPKYEFSEPVNSGYEQVAPTVRVVCGTCHKVHQLQWRGSSFAVRSAPFEVDGAIKHPVYAAYDDKGNEIARGFSPIAANHYRERGLRVEVE